jgi:alanine racemase
MAFIKISRDNYIYNLNKILERVESKDQIAVVLKDNAYGHGTDIIAPLAREFGISRAVVRTVKEAKKLEDMFPYILILAPEVIESRPNFFYTINSADDLYKYPKDVNLELKVDTGMHRLGISPFQLYFALNSIKSRNLRLRGFFTHFREADQISSTLYTQRELFQTLKKDVIDSCFNEIHTHSNNSAGVFRAGEKIKDEIVRVGISTYGYMRGDKALHFPELKPVLSLHAKRVGELKQFQPNFRIGYGGVSEVGDAKKVSIYDVGYGDGFRRLSDRDILSGRFKTPNGSRVFGKVSMDSTVFDSDVKSLEIFNDTGDLAEIFGTIDYEILVSLSRDIERKLV